MPSKWCPCLSTPSVLPLRCRPKWHFSRALSDDAFSLMRTVGGLQSHGVHASLVVVPWGLLLTAEAIPDTPTPHVHALPLCLASLPLRYSVPSLLSPGTRSFCGNLNWTLPVGETANFSRSSSSLFFPVLSPGLYFCVVHSFGY